MELYEKNCLRVNQVLLGKLGLYTGVYLTYLMDYGVDYDLGNVGEKFFSVNQKNIEDNIGLNPYKQRKCLDKLLKLKLISVKRIGLPARYWYKVNYNNITKFLKK